MILNLKFFVLSFILISYTGRCAGVTHPVPKGKGKPLFDPQHPNITFLTDKNFKTTLAADPRPWLVDFYHPFCPHCKVFAPDWIKIAAYYKAEGSIAIGALSCMDNRICRKVGVDSFPALLGYQFNPAEMGTEVDRVIGTHTIKEVHAFVQKLKTKGQALAANATLVANAEPKKEINRTIWEESTLPSTKITRLQDAASAFIFGLKQGIFNGREILDDVHLDALKEWLRVVSQTFPGVFNRKMIAKLYHLVEPKPYLEFDQWDTMLRIWQNYTVTQQEAALAMDQQNAVGLFRPLNRVKQDWERLPNLFAGEGDEYVACALYTCGQWNLFHMMTVNVYPVGHETLSRDRAMWTKEERKREDQLAVSVLGVTRRFMKHFFGCLECRDHFLEENTITMVQEASRAKHKRKFLKRWLWQMHNSVNERIFHPQWPKPEVCDNCRLTQHQEKFHFNNVMLWLDDTFGYVERDEESSRFSPELWSSVPEVRQGHSVFGLLFCGAAVGFFMWFRVGRHRTTKKDGKTKV